MHLRPEFPPFSYNMSDIDRSPSPSATNKDLAELANKMAELQCKQQEERAKKVRKAAEWREHEAWEKKEHEEHTQGETEECTKEEAERMHKKKEVAEKEKGKEKKKGSRSGSKVSAKSVTSKHC